MTPEADKPETGEDLEELAALVYRSLCRIAASLFSREDNALTLQPTALVHEAYVRLAGQDANRFRNHAHFLSIAARMMRRVLVDAARARGTAKRGVDFSRVTLSSQTPDSERFEIDALDLESALIRLGEIKERFVQLVELRFYAGMTIPEIAEALELSERQVLRDWNIARSHLALFLEEPEE